VIELEVVGVTTRPKSDEQKQRLREQVQALAEQPGPPMSDEQKRRLRERVQTFAAQADPWLTLKERIGDRVIEFGIGVAEAQAIALALQGDVESQRVVLVGDGPIPPRGRPMTHDLIGNLLRALDDVSVLRVVITKREHGTFYATLVLRHQERIINLDCRPSDAIAVAVRLGLPIFAAEELEPVLSAA
jgi:bifunctional DNase/RNase